MSLDTETVRRIAKLARIRVEEAELAGPLYGTGSEVAEKLRRLAAELQVQEVAITTFAYDPQLRRNSFTILAKEFGLETTGG